MKYLLLFFGILFVAEAKEMPVLIKTDYLNSVDISLPFTLDEKTTVEKGLALSVIEYTALSDVLNGQKLDYSQIDDFVSALNKLQKGKGLSSDEKKYLTKGDAYEKMKFLSRKKIMDL